MGELVAPRFLLLYAWVASAALRAFARQGPARLQPPDHRPLDDLRAAQRASSTPPRPCRARRMLDPRDFPDLTPLRDHWHEIRDEARGPARRRAGAAVRRRTATSPSTRSSSAGGGASHLKWYDDFLPSAQTLCPRTVDLVRSVPTVHAALFAFLPPGGKLDRAPRSLCRLAALPPGAHHAQLGRVSHLRRRRAVRVARRRGRRLRRDLHPPRREPHGPGPHHPVLRRRTPAPDPRHARAEPLHRAPRLARHLEPQRGDGAPRAW